MQSVIMLMILSGLVCGQPAQLPIGKLRTISVCELLSRRIDYNGKMIKVRGEVKGGGHGVWLVADTNCDFRVVTDSVVWPNYIYLTYPSPKKEHGEMYAEFVVDADSVAAAERTIQRAGFQEGKDRIFQTFIGRFVTYGDLRLRSNAGTPGSRRVGFGPVGLDAPAQILIKEILETKLVRGEQQ